MVGLRAGERALLVTEQLALDEVLGQRAAVDRHERTASARLIVNRARDHFLAGARFALDEHRDLRRRDLPQPLDLDVPRRHQRGESRGTLFRGQLEQARGIDLDGQPLEEDEQRVAELDQRAIGEHRTLGGVAIDDRAVLGLGIGQDPAPEARLDARVARRHPLVRNPDRQLGARQLGAAIRSATERDRRQLAEPIPDRSGARTPALQREHEHGLGSRTEAACLAILVEAKGGSLRVAHAGILQHVCGSIDCQTTRLAFDPWAIC